MFLLCVRISFEGCIFTAGLSRCLRCTSKCLHVSMDDWLLCHRSTSYLSVSASLAPLLLHIVFSFLYSDFSEPSHFLLLLSPDFPLLCLPLSLACLDLSLLFKRPLKSSFRKTFQFTYWPLKALAVRFGCHGTVNGVYLLNGKREPQHRSHLRGEMAADITAGTEHYPSVKENGDLEWMWIICFTANIVPWKQKGLLLPSLRHGRHRTANCDFFTRLIIEKGPQAASINNFKGKGFIVNMKIP